MNVIPITSPVDYFEMNTVIDQDNWTFIFKWNESYGLFHIDFYLNNEAYLLSIAVLGGVICFPDYTLGYNFMFLSSVDLPYSVSDLGVNISMYEMTTEDAQALGLLKS